MINNIKGMEEEEEEERWNLIRHLAFPSNNFSIKNFTEQWNFPIRGNEPVDALRESRNRSAWRLNRKVASIVVARAC